MIDTRIEPGGALAVSVSTRELVRAEGGCARSATVEV